MKLESSALFTQVSQNIYPVHLNLNTEFFFSTKKLEYEK